jgi:hypothetical protein
MTNEIAEKWGFGMAPPKPATQRERSLACSSILNLLNRSEQPKAAQEVVAHLSIAKGLFNRIVREDQWDWFTVSAQLGYPSRGLAHSIAFELSNLRSAIRYADATCFANAHANLLRLPQAPPGRGRAPSPHKHSLPLAGQLQLAYVPATVTLDVTPRPKWLQ